jgi:hypothetical protein
MITPTSAAIGHVKAITLGTRAAVSCHTRLVGIFTLKRISENRLACWTKRMTLRRSHEKKKYGKTAWTKYLEINKLNLSIRVS